MILRMGGANSPFIDEESSGGRNTIGVVQFVDGENNSVDGDDGSVDGADLLGVGWMGMFRGSTISFVFGPRVLPDGRRMFPTYFGFAVTSVVRGDETYVNFTNEQEAPLGSERVPASAFPEFQAGQRGVVTDRFVSFYVPTGAEIMHIGQGIYTIDHLTYGWDPIPEPGAAVLALSSSLVFLLRRRR